MPMLYIVKSTEANDLDNKVLLPAGADIFLSVPCKPRQM